MISYLTRIAITLPLTLSTATLVIAGDNRSGTDTTDTLSTIANSEHDSQTGSADETIVHEAAGTETGNFASEPEVAAALPEHEGAEDTPSISGAVEYNIDQKNKRFSQSSITIKVGDTINFINSDSYFHNVYSLSDAAQFDLGSYPKGESKSITFEKPGEIMARCAIHPQMQIDITIEENK